jgi:NAD(P)-dependent dehydrogenase (short-subunit alcohol dehydrogenase family)
LRFSSWYSYRASKAAQNQLTRTLAHELKLRKKLAIALGLHPGTVVRTALSSPFTANREPDEKQGTFEAPEAADKLSQVVGKASESDSGRVLDWAGQRIPW